MNTGKFATKGGEAANFWATTVLVELRFLPCNSWNNRLAMAATGCCVSYLPPHTVWNAHSRCRAAVNTDEMTATNSSILTDCSVVCCKSILAMSDGRTKCMKTGRSLGVLGVLGGITRAKVANRLQSSIWPRLATAKSSVHNSSMNFEGVVILRQRSILSEGVFPARAARNAWCKAIRGCSSHQWLCVGREAKCPPPCQWTESLGDNTTNLHDRAPTYESLLNQNGYYRWYFALS